jgi:hypothetical protein
MTTKFKLTLAAALVLGAAGLSLGGHRSTQEVYIFSTSYATTAMGNITDARNSADANQQIGCDVTSTAGNQVAYCYARNAAGQSVACYMNNATRTAVDQVLSIRPHSNVQFTYSPSTGQCGYIKVSNHSNAGGMQ